MIVSTLLLSMQWFPIFISAICILSLWVFRWRHETLAAKYASWQNEAQAIEIATHNALYQFGLKRKKLRGQTIVENEDLKPNNDNYKPSYPTITIVIPVYKDEEQLKYLLPRLQKMQYNGKFEIIVSDQIASEDTHDIVRQYATDFPNLRYTRIPPSSRQIERRKLAITLGIKAARSEWVIIIKPHTVPETNDWLQHFAQNLDPEINFVETYYNYYDDGSLKARRAILERVRAFNLRLNAYEQGLILGSSPANYAVRKTWFIQQRGFAESLTLPFGEDSIFAYAHANANHSIMLCSPDTKLMEYLPNNKELLNRRIRRAETIKYILHMGWKKSAANSLTHRLHQSFLEKVIWCHPRWYCLREHFCSLFFYLFLFCFIFYTIWRTRSIIEECVYNLNYIYSDLIMLLFLFIFLFVPIRQLRCTLRALNERKYGLYIIFYDLLQPWKSLAISIKRSFYHDSFVHHKI